MAGKPKEPAKRRPPTRTREKPLSLYPLTLEEAVDRMLKATPAPEKPKRRR
jgi:hypothetical protein